jgi:hypothetical protein
LALLFATAGLLPKTAAAAIKVPIVARIMAIEP